MKEFEQNPPQISGFSISRMQYLISLIISHKQDNHPGAYSLLCMGYLKNVIPRADEYLNFLKDQKIIEWINYCAGRNSRMYRLLSEGKTDYRAISDKKLIFKIEKNRQKIRRQNSKKYPALNEFIHKIKIDYEAALKTVESTYLKNIREGNVKAEGRRTFSLCEIDKIQSGEIFIKVSKTNGRLDSNFTRLPSELLQHLSIDGNPLFELDIRNSQPFFAAALLNPTPEIIDLMNKVLGRSFTIYAKFLHISECEDVKLYRSLVTSGKFYDPFMMEKFKEHGIYFKNRDDLKKQLFVVFFGKIHAYKYSPAAKLFKSIFPNIQILFNAIKKDKHNCLAILLQKIESYTILERVAKNILSECPEQPFITRHDSLLPSGIMVCNDVDKVKKIMLKTIQEVTGLIPQVRIKPHTEKPVEKFKIRPHARSLPIKSIIPSINSNILHSISICTLPP